MKLGVTYIAFDGIELIEHSIKQIRNHVDYISVIYQNVSWFNKKLPNESLVELKSLVNKKLVDEIIPFSSFSPLYNKSAHSILKSKGYEREKRQFALFHCLKRGCTHFLCMDVDEFYVSQEFAYAKAEIAKNNYDLTAVRFINYVNVPTVHRGYDPMRVPFICKVTNSSKLGKNFFVKCDPTRGISNGSKKHEFNPSLITMHHMESVRKDLFLKYDSTTRAVFKRERTQALVQEIQRVNHESHLFDFKKIIFPGVNNVKLTHCKNIFNIPYESWIK